MKVNLPPALHHRRGMALLVIMVLLAVMCVLMICAAQSLFSVKRELNRIEKKQLQRVEKAPVSMAR